MEKQSRYSNVKYMLVELHVRTLHHRLFLRRMPKVIRLFMERFNWELVYAAYPISGELNKFVHIWRIRGEDDVLRLMVDGAEDGDEEDVDEGRESFSAAYRDVQELIVKTRHVFMASLPYDPTQLGEQEHTIVIGVDKVPSIFLNSDLREKLSDCQVTPGPNSKLDTYLSSGVTSGRLDQNFFFNLASLKPTSVFQMQKVRFSEGGVVLFPQGVPGPDPAPPKLIVAAVEGRVYSLGEDKLKEIINGIPEVEQAKTTELLKPIIDGKVPLANIPTPRRIKVGEGCLCFVINLNSFA